jgi:hypothetical protein
MIGKLETPLKMIIEHESDVMSNKNSIQKDLFNIETSKKFGETIVGTSEFDVFTHAAEGAGAENDSIQETFKKFIEHIQFMKEFTITAEMMEDANYGVGADAKRRAEQFARAYYRTMNKICSTALINGTTTSAVFSKANLNLTTIDGLSLFHKAHTLHAPRGKVKTQANYFNASEWSTSADGGVETMLAHAANKIRNMRDENGEILGYNADTIIIPGNRPAFENKVKKACGSEKTTGTNKNDVNIQYGNWNIVVLPDWQPADNRFMIMSSEANKNLSGNMFFNRVPLTISHWVDHHTGNYIWNGRCRFGVGFGNYKHIALITDMTTNSAAETITLS